jgi:hypothetical protein
VALSLSLASPSVSTLKLRFSLPSDADARIEVFDVAGRRVRERALTGMGLGEHSLQIGPEGLRPGLYLVRLRQDRDEVTARTLLVP